MDFTKLMFGGAIFGILASCWSYIKDISHKIFGLFVQTIHIKDHDLACSVVGYLRKKYKVSQFHDKHYYTHNMYLNTYGKYGSLVLQEFAKCDLVFWNNWLPIFYRFVDNNNSKSSTIVHDNGQHTPNNNSKSLSCLYFIKGTMDIEKIISEANHIENQRYWNMLDNNAESRFVITTFPRINSSAQPPPNDPWWYVSSQVKVLGYKIDEIGHKNNSKKSLLSRLVYPPDTLKKIKIARKWYNNSEWYKEKGIPWKTGWLLHGPPGCGKSALAQAIGMELNVPIFSFRLSEMTSQDFTEYWREMQKSTPCIALIEDIDNVFDKRKNIAGVKDVLCVSGSILKGISGSDPGRIQTELTFDTFLNVLDGVERYEGVFTIITTNDFSKIDSALYARPGRIDKVIELTYLTYEDKISMANGILGEYPDLLKEIINKIEENKNEEITPAQFQEKCVSTALASFMEND